MYKNLPDQEAAPELGFRKEGKLIGDRGNYFLNRMQGETGYNVSEIAFLF